MHMPGEVVLFFFGRIMEFYFALRHAVSRFLAVIWCYDNMTDNAGEGNAVSRLASLTFFGDKINLHDVGPT
jgi:hypothetical protein